MGGKDHYGSYIYILFTETQMLRKVPPVYSDGSYEPAGDDRPPPMNVSRVVFIGETGHQSYKNRTAFMVFFGNHTFGLFHLNSTNFQGVQRTLITDFHGIFTKMAISQELLDPVVSNFRFVHLNNH
jgi:hypothetical protein